MLLWASFSGVQFGAYEHLRKVDPLRYAPLGETRSSRSQERGPQAVLERSDGSSHGGGREVVPEALCHFIYGATSGALGTVVTYPLDITRTALAYQVWHAPGRTSMAGTATMMP